MACSQVKSSYEERDPPNFASNTASEPYRAPYARVSSLEDPSTNRTEYGKAPLASSGIPPRAEETLKAHVPDAKSLKMDKNQVNSEKTSVKESSKGLRRLLMFGKKNSSSSSVDRSVDSECASGEGIEHDNSARKTTPTGEGDLYYSNSITYYKSYADHFLYLEIPSMHDKPILVVKGHSKIELLIFRF